MSSAAAWRIADNLGLAWQDWDEDEVVVFSQRLGHSLLLSAPSARILSFLADRAPQSASLSELAEHLLACCAPGTSRTEALAVLDLALPEFYRIGLAEPLADTLVTPN
ncbi:MAG TPA: hypothetical protein VGE56_01575 [Rhodocyclaceae bacterium]